MRYILFLLILFMTFPVKAGELTGFVAFDTRIFFYDSQFAGQEESFNPSLVAEPEYFHISEDENNIFTFRPFLRVDSHDKERTHYDIRQLDWLHIGDDWEVQIGASKVFWGVIESNHLVNIINQIDTVEDVDAEDYLGQPMIQFAWLQEWGTLRFFYLPYFRERTFAGPSGRLRGDPYVDASLSTYTDAAEQWHQDIAVRYEHVIGDWDIGLSHFSGTGREPRLIAGTGKEGESVFIPTYDLIDQTGVDLQYTTDAWLWKFEGITRSGQGDRFVGMAAGVEYTFFNILDEGPDLGLLAEYHRDDRDSTAPITTFDDDIFFGSRMTLNDEFDTEFLAGFLFDRFEKDRAYSFEASRRLSDNWTIEMDVRMYGGSNPSDVSFGFAQDDHIQLRLAHYF